MAETYNIGSYQCRSKEEYISMCSDIKIIKYLREKYDCKNPEVAQKILSYIETKPIHFAPH